MNYNFSIWSLALLLIGPQIILGAENPVSPPAVPNANQGASVNKETYVIVVGDRLDYRVVEDRDETTVIPVQSNGDIEVPYYGRVDVAGKTLTQAAERIKSLIEKDLYYKATVLISLDAAMQTMKALKPSVVTVSGAVRSPGPQDMPVGEKYMVSRAILKAGSFTPFADGKHVRIIRRGENGKPVEITVNVINILSKGKIEEDVELKPEDLVIVKESWIKF